MADRTQRLRELSRDFASVQTQLYGCGRQLIDTNPLRLYQLEHSLYRAYIETVFEHFGDAKYLNPNTMWNDLTKIDPDGIRITSKAANDLHSAVTKTLPYTPDVANSPFSLRSNNLHSSVRMFDLPYSMQTQPTLVITDKNAEGYHVCFTHIPDAVGLSAMNSIENLAREVRKEMGLKAMFTPIHFYLHVPAECGLSTEKFIKVEMKKDLFGSYSEPQFIHMDTMPAGIHKAMNEHITSPQPDAYNEKYSLAAYRRFALKSHQRELGL